MGDGTPPPPGGGGGGGGPCDLTPVLNFLNTLYNLLNGVFGSGGSNANTDLFTAGTAASQPYPNSKIVKKALIQNLSATDNLTVVFLASSPGKVAPIVAGKGTVLNAASVAGQGGGSMPVGNVDLSSITVITNTNNTQSYSVYYEY